jgi:hypothetical protein
MAMSMLLPPCCLACDAHVLVVGFMVRLFEWRMPAALQQLLIRHGRPSSCQPSLGESVLWLP